MHTSRRHPTKPVSWVDVVLRLAEREHGPRLGRVDRIAPVGGHHACLKSRLAPVPGAVRASGSVAVLRERLRLATSRRRCRRRNTQPGEQDGPRDERDGPHGQLSVSIRTTPNSTGVPAEKVAPGGGLEVHTCQLRSMSCARPWPVRSVEVL